MAQFTQEELQQRSFYRAAWVLWHFWEEQQDDPKQEARVHSRLFDTLVHAPLIFVGQSKNGSGHIEHLVPCALIRDQAFHMFHNGKSKEDVAVMIGRFLKIAHITREEAKHLDHVLKFKTTMPADWDFETGSVMRRLEIAEIELLTDK
jgi:hypothetical protein